MPYDLFLVLGLAWFLSLATTVGILLGNPFRR